MIHNFFGPVPMAMMLGIDAWIFWLVLAVAFLIMEVATVNLVSIWFVAGSLAGVVADLLGAGIWVQILVMLVVSGLLLGVFLYLRPHLGISGRKATATNADRIIGQTALVTQDIDPVAGTGQVKALGQVWSAISSDASRIPAGTLTLIVAIRGVRAVVQPQKNP